MNQVFKIGEKVISLYSNQQSDTQPRVRGKLYKVLDILYCCRCGAQSINVSGKIVNRADIDPSRIIMGCCRTIQANTGLWWTISTAFIRPEDIEEAIEHFAKKDEFETCQVLKQFEEEQLVRVEKTKKISQ